jgi:hypothetical protein
MKIIIILMLISHDCNAVGNVTVNANIKLIKLLAEP